MEQNTLPTFSSHFQMQCFSSLLEYLKTSEDKEQHKEICQHIATLEKTPKAILVPNSRIAFAACFLASGAAGSHILVHHHLSAIGELWLEELAQLGVAIDRADFHDPNAIEAAFHPKTRAMWLEIPSQPFLDIVDTTVCAQLAKQAGVMFAVDESLGTPLLFKEPHPADIIICSGNYLTGLGDAIGYIAGYDAFLEHIQPIITKLSPDHNENQLLLLQQAWESLSLRLTKQSQTALAIAEFFRKNNKITQIFYPGLSTHPDHAQATRCLQSYGSIMTWNLDTDWQGCLRFLEYFKIIKISPIWGQRNTTIEHLSSMNYLMVHPNQKAKLGIGPGTIQLSIGMEKAEDIIQDLDQALRRI